MKVVAARPLLQVAPFPTLFRCEHLPDSSSIWSSRTVCLAMLPVGGTGRAAPPADRKLAAIFAATSSTVPGTASSPTLPARSTPSPARDLIERALTLNADSALAWCARGYVLAFANQPDPAIGSFTRAMHFSPVDPLGHIFKYGLAMAHAVAGRFEEAMKWTDQVLREQPRHPTVVRYKAALYGHLGNTAAGQKYVRDLLRRFPGITVKSIEQNMNVNTGA